MNWIIEGFLDGSVIARIRVSASFSQGGNIDLFVVNSFGSGFQVIVSASCRVFLIYMQSGSFFTRIWIVLVNQIFSLWNLVSCRLRSKFSHVEKMILLFQALFVLLLLPLLSNMRGIPFHQLGSYFRDGSVCFFNVGSSIGIIIQ